MSMDHKVKIAVCDDRQADLEKIVSMAKEILQDENIPHKIYGYDNAKLLLNDIQTGVQYDILLLDALMAGMSGMELAVELRKQHNNITIVFVSANREMALYGYEVSAVRYLAKPLDEGKMKEAILYCCRSGQDKKQILLPTNHSLHRISISDIQFVEAFGRGAKFVLVNETVESKLKLSELEDLLPKSEFILCHRSYMVNLSYVKHISRCEFLLTNEQNVPISKGRYSQVYKKFVEYIAD